jgi:hypothetical protein
MKALPSLCHPDRSVAKWRDLQFRGPLLEMFFERAERSAPEFTADPQSTPAGTSPGYPPNN